MADIFSKQKRSEVMSRIRSKNTKPEIALRKLVSTHFYPLGYRYRLHYKKLPGTPDIAFVSRKIALFVDGAFWHGYNHKKTKAKLPKKYWLPKIQQNMRRDRRVNRRLRNMGWTVIRIWEHEVKKDSGKIVRAVSGLLIQDEPYRKK